MQKYTLLVSLLLLHLGAGCGPTPAPKPAPKPMPPISDTRDGATDQPAVQQSGELHTPLSPTPAPTTAPPVERPKIIGRVTLAAMGDLLPHNSVQYAARHLDQRDAQGKTTNNGGYDALFDPIRDELKGIDLAFVNLETPIAPKTGAKPIPWFFNAHPDLLSAMQKLGVNLVSFANNHVYDQKERGLQETVEHLQTHGFTHAGAGRTCKEAQAYRLVEKNGIKIAFLAATDLINQDLNKGNGDLCTFRLDEKIALAQVKAARNAGAEMVIMSLHYGQEYKTQPTAKEVARMHRLMDGGVDILLGHHPHVLRPVELYQAADGRLTCIAYSLGNFISNQSRFYIHGVWSKGQGNPRDGVILRLSMVRVDYGEGVRPVELADLSVQPLWTENNAVARKVQKKLPVRIKVVANDREVQKLRARLADTALDKAARIKLKKHIQLLEDRRRIAGKVLGEDFLNPIE